MSSHAKFNQTELSNHTSYHSLLIQASRLPLRTSQFRQADLLDNTFRHVSQNIWSIPQTDAGNKEIARGATLPKAMREGILQHTPTLPSALHPAFHTISCSPQKSMLSILSVTCPTVLAIHHLFF